MRADTARATVRSQEDQVLGAIMAELGVETASAMKEAPTANPVAADAGAAAAQPQGAVAGGTADGGGSGGGGGDDLDAELQRRLDNLRRT